jgi:hypothetical protein
MKLITEPSYLIDSKTNKKREFSFPPIQHESKISWTTNDGCSIDGYLQSNLEYKFMEIEREVIEAKSGTESLHKVRYFDFARKKDVLKIVESVHNRAEIEGLRRIHVTGRLIKKYVETVQKAKIKRWLTPLELEAAAGKSDIELTSLYGDDLEDIAYISRDWARAIFQTEVADLNVYTSRAYFVNHVLNHHWQDFPKEQYEKIQTIINEHDEVIRDVRINEKGTKRNGVIFVKKIDKNYLLAISLEEKNGKIQIYKSLSSTKRKPYPNLERVSLPVDANPMLVGHPHDTVAFLAERPAAGGVPALGNTCSLENFSVYDNSNSTRLGNDSVSLHIEAVHRLFELLIDGKYKFWSGPDYLNFLFELASFIPDCAKIKSDIQLVMKIIRVKDLSDWRRLDPLAKQICCEILAREIGRFGE